MKNNILVAIGEVLIDFIPDRKNCDFSEVTSFLPALGGAPANVCGAFSRLGGKSRLLTKLGDDPFGRKIIKELNSYGIDTAYIKTTNEANTALAFVSLSADGNRTFSFYRNPSADMLYTPEELDEESLKDIFCLHFCSVSLGEFSMKYAHKKAIETARRNNSIISFDFNLRFPLWNDTNLLYKTVNEFIPQADIIKVSDEELEFITGEKSADSGIEKLFKGNVKLVLYTCGKNGSYAYNNHNKIYNPSYDVKAVDTTGAGDGFMGSFLWKFSELGIDINNLENSESKIKECLDFANKFCSISVQKKGAIASYPTLENIKI